MEKIYSLNLEQGLPSGTSIMEHDGVQDAAVTVIFEIPPEERPNIPKAIILD